MRKLSYEEVRKHTLDCVGVYALSGADDLHIFSIRGDTDNVVVADRLNFWLMSGWELASYVAEHGFVLTDEEDVKLPEEWVDPGNYPKKSKTVTRNGYTYLPFIPLY